MVKLIAITNTSYVEKSENTFIYSFPSSAKFTNKSKVGLVSLSVYNSTFNITQSRGNNTVTFIWPSATPVTVNWTIPDGYFSANDLNSWLQSQMFANNYYVTSNNGTNVVYFYEIVQNSVRYSIQLNSYYIPTSANATTLGYSQPAGATWAYPATNKTPQLTFGTAFGSLIGMTAQTFPATVQSTNQSQISTITPIISPVNSYILTCNLINSKYSIPSNVFFSLPLNGSLGQLISYVAPSVVYSDIAPNTYSNIIIQMFDQNFNKLELKDNEIVLTLAIDDSLEAS
jgi:hypothetical protein